MGFVPVTGTATFRPAVPPRDGVVEFTDERRTVALPVRAAIPVLTKAHARDDLDPSVALLSGAALLGMRLVAAGAFEPAPEQDGAPPSWRVAELSAEHEDRVRMLARSRAAEGRDAEDAEAVVRAVLDAVADAVPRGAPVARARPAAPRPAAPVVRRQPDGDFHDRLQRRLARHRDATLPHLVTVSLRVEADEEELVAGAVRLVLQVHDERDPLHLADAASLWLDEPEVHGFGERARTHATIALRAAAEAWPVLDRLLELRVPDQLTLDGEEIADLLEHGVAALAARGVDVLWPRSLGRDLTTRAVLDTAPKRGRSAEAPLQTGLLTPDAVFAFSWEVAVGGDPLTAEEMAQLATAAAPIMKLRGAWTVVDPSVARKARKRLVREVRPAEAIAAALSGVATLGASGGAEPAQVVVGASLLQVRERLLAAASREPIDPPAALQATLRDYQRHGLTWLADLTGLGLGACLADDMGLGKTLTLISLHLHRAEAARAAGGTPAPTLVVCPTSLLGNWEAEIRRFAPGVPVRRFHGGTRSLAGLGAAAAVPAGAVVDAVIDAGLFGAEELEPVGEGAVDDPGFVLTTYGTMRVDTTGGAEGAGSELAAVPWGLVVADEAQHVKNSRSSTARGLRSIPSGARVALTGTPVENDLTELWSILDWCIPGLLGSRQAFRRVWASPIEAGVDPEVARRFADLIGPFLLRRRKSDPGIAPELPPKTETDHPLSLTREQVVLYEAFVRDTMERIERADEHTRRGLVLSLLTGCKQICNHPAHFLKQGGGRIAGRSEKIDLLDELLGTVLAEDGAALVFTQYVEMARLVARHLTQAGIPHQLLHGGTPVRDREEMVRRFQSDGEDRVPVFLLSLKAGGTGLNLTRAEHVVHLDRWWNPAVEDQATDRAYRIGQTRPVQVHRMVTRGTIEERVGLLLDRKRALADAVLGGGEAALTELSDDELRDLVALRPEQ